MAYTPATKLPSLYFFQWATPDDPAPSLNAPISATATTLIFSVAPVDHNGTAITGGFLMGVKSSTGYVENIYVPTGAISGTTATGVVRGVRLEGLDYTTGDSTLAIAHSAGEQIFCNITGVFQAISNAVLQGTVASGGSNLIIGTDALGTTTISRSTGTGTYVGFLRWLTGTTKAQFSNDGASWVNFDSVSASNLVQVSAADTTPNYLDNKISGTNITKTITSPGGNEVLNLQARGTLANVISDVTSTAAEVNKLSGTSANVTSTNLNTLTAGAASNADSLHTHSSFGVVSLTAGETITGATNAVPVCIGSSSYKRQYRANTNRWATSGSVAYQNFGNADASTRVSEDFIFTDALAQSIVVNSINVLIRDSGAPADNTYIEIQTDSGGSPSGTVITNGTSGNVSGGTITANALTWLYTFATPPTITSGTKYHIVVRRSGANDAVNYYQIGYDDNVWSYGNRFKTYTASSGLWADAGGASSQLFAAVNVTISYGGRVFKSDANNLPFVRCDGFATSNSTAGSSINVQTFGVVSNLPTMTQAENQYISTTAGSLTSTPTAANLTAVTHVGKAHSTTALNFTPSIITMRGSEPVFMGFNASTGTTMVYFIETGFRPVNIRILLKGTGGGGTYYTSQLSSVLDGEIQDFNIYNLNSSSQTITASTTVALDNDANDGTANNSVVVSGVYSSGFELTITTNSSNILNLDWIAQGF